MSRIFYTLQFKIDYRWNCGSQTRANNGIFGRQIISKSRNWISSLVFRFYSTWLLLWVIWKGRYIKINPKPFCTCRTTSELNPSLILLLRSYRCYNTYFDFFEYPTLTTYVKVKIEDISVTLFFTLDVKTIFCVIKGLNTKSYYFRLSSFGPSNVSCLLKLCVEHLLILIV